MGGVLSAHGPVRLAVTAMRKNSGVSLIEILLGLLVVTIASIATLQYFAYAKGNMGIQGNRRAALERARERLEQLLAASFNAIEPTLQAPPATQNPVTWLTCAGSPCTWTKSLVRTTQTVAVDDLPTRPIETTAQWMNDPDSPTTSPSSFTPDTVELGVKVWFTMNTGADDDFNRVLVKTLRTP